MGQKSADANSRTSHEGRLCCAGALSSRAGGSGQASSPHCKCCLVHGIGWLNCTPQAAMRVASTQVYQHLPSADTKHFDQYSRAVGLGRSPAAPQDGQDNQKESHTKNRQNTQETDSRSGRGRSAQDRGTDREITRMRRGGGRTAL